MFPGHQEPVSPYIDEDLPVITDFKKFIINESDSVIEDPVHRTAFQDAVEKLAERYEEARGLGRERTSQGGKSEASKSGIDHRGIEVDERNLFAQQHLDTSFYDMTQMRTDFKEENMFDFGVHLPPDI